MKEKEIDIYSNQVREEEEKESENGSQEVKRQDNELERAKKRFGKIFDDHEDGTKRVEDILSRIRPFLESDLIDGKKIHKSLEQCSTIETKGEFIEKAFSALEPILDLKMNNPDAFEKIQREAFVEQSGFTRLNEVLSYGEYDNVIHIHLAPSKEIGIGKVRTLVREGLEKLAGIVKEKEEVKEVTATSWIVAEHPKLMEILGFTVKGEIDQETRERHFMDDNREIHRATMERKDFLSKYLRE